MPTFDTTPEWRATQLAFLARQFLRSPPPLPTHVSLINKTIIITGGNTGLGFACASQLLDLGLTTLILAVRNTAKGETARNALLANRDASKHTIEIWPLDLADYDSIVSFVERAKSLPNLHVLLNNAGLVRVQHELIPRTGHEQVVQVNYLSTALLTLLMLPILKAKNTSENPGRVVIVSSDTASWCAFPERTADPILPALDDPANWHSDHERYSMSKLLGQLFVRELTTKISPQHVLISAVNPGLCHSDLLRDFRGLKESLTAIFMWTIARRVEVGALALTDAIAVKAEESHGVYLEDGKLQPWAPMVYTPSGERLQRLLWEETMEDLKFAGVQDIVERMSII